MKPLNQHRKPEWLYGALVGIVAAVAGTATLLGVGAAAGRGLDTLTNVGAGPWPSLVRSVTGAPPALSYLLSHTTLYLLAGLAGIAVARLADRVSVVLAGLAVLVLVIEYGFIVVMAQWQGTGRFDWVTWRSVVYAHAVADICLLLGIIRVHPSIRAALERANPWS
jgi:hypothetical protein